MKQMQNTAITANIINISVNHSIIFAIEVSTSEAWELGQINGLVLERTNSP